MGKSIFHYSSVETFFNIIDSDELRFGNIQQFRDSNEQKYFGTFLKKYLKNSKNDYQSIWKEHQHKLNSNIYAACFSYNGNLLSQWRAYADDGSGISIGFNTTFFQIYKDPFKLLQPYSDTFFIGDIIYSPKEQQRLLDQYGKKIIDLAKAENSNYEEFAAHIMLTLSVLFKSQYFTEENEVRLYICPYQLKPGQHYQAPEYKPIDKNLKLFIPFKIKPDDPGDPDKIRFPINRIWIGPRSKLTKDDIKSFLIHYDYYFENLQIRKSRISYV